MRLEYSGLDGQLYLEDLREIKVSGILLHSTPDERVERILAEGLKISMPKTKLLVDLDAIFCTIPSATPNTKDLFRYYKDWSIVLIDTAKIPEHSWYVDFLAEEDPSNNGSNKHIMTFQNIPPIAIKKIIK